MLSNSGVRLAPTFACKGMTYTYIESEGELSPFQLNINIIHKCGCNELTLTSLSLSIWMNRVFLFGCFFTVESDVWGLEVLDQLTLEFSVNL